MLEGKALMLWRPSKLGRNQQTVDPRYHLDSSLGKHTQRHLLLHLPLLAKLLSSCTAVFILVSSLGLFILGICMINTTQMQNINALRAVDARIYRRSSHFPRSTASSGNFRCRKPVLFGVLAWRL